MRVTKREWYNMGGFKNPACYRKHNGRHWQYYIDTSHPSYQQDYR